MSSLPSLCERLIKHVLLTGLSPVISFWMGLIMVAAVLSAA